MVDKIFALVKPDNIVAISTIGSMYDANSVTVTVSPADGNLYRIEAPELLKIMTKGLPAIIYEGRKKRNGKYVYLTPVFEE